MQPERNYPLASVLSQLDVPYRLEGQAQGKSIARLMQISTAEPDALTWLDPDRQHKQQELDLTRAGAVVCDESLQPNSHGTVLIKVENPRLTFIRLAAQLFAEQVDPGIDASAVVHKDARIGRDVHIGAHCGIGCAEIGDGCVIHGGVHIYDGVRIGRGVTVQSGCVIGVRAFSLAKDEQGEWCHMPHVGGVQIEDNVEIQALCVIDRGTLGDTVIRSGALINSGCYIAHNVRIGQRTFIAGHTVLAGSVEVGDDCWIGPKVAVRDRLRIGNGCFVGLGSVVVRNLDEGERVMGNPARPIDESKRILSYLRKAALGDP